AEPASAVLAWIWCRGRIKNLTLAEREANRLYMWRVVAGSLQHLEKRPWVGSLIRPRTTRTHISRRRLRDHHPVKKRSSHLRIAELLVQIAPQRCQQLAPTVVAPRPIHRTRRRVH